MPIYEYRCNGCNNDFEYLVFGSDEPKECPSCSGKQIQKIMSACGFFSKGEGGETMKSAAADSGCGSCAATSCACCGC